jgi:hypothetical protein
MLQSSVLIDAVFCLLREGKKEKKKKRDRIGQGFFSPGQICFAGYAVLGFSSLLGAIKSCFKGQSLNFICT